MSAGFEFEGRLEFSSAGAEALRAVPAGPGVFALRGERPGDQAYVTRAADLRRRVARLLAPAEIGADGAEIRSKRLNLRERVRFIEWTRTGSEFESMLLLYRALAADFGVDQARRRMRLHPPYCVRLTLEHEHPRIYVTNRLSRRDPAGLYGPFGSRAGAERYMEGVLDLFRLRRCWEDLEVHPDHPGCAYGEMKRCMAPCNLGCSPQEYSAEAAAVKAFLETRGESLLEPIGRQRDQASEAMDFERAAELHEKYSKMKAIAALADDLVRPLQHVRAVVLQKAADGEGTAAAVFLVQDGRIAGPERLSTLGVRAVREQTSVGSSLFAQPLMLQAVPLNGPDGPTSEAESPEARATGLLQRLEASVEPWDASHAGDLLSLLRRWYYRPEKQRAGEVFLPNPDATWPVRRILRGAARLALGEPREMQPTNREAAAGLKTKLLHEGREGVERLVAVAGKRTRRSKPAEVNQT